MSRVRPLEAKAIVSLLRMDWEDVEDLAHALIQELDKVRAGRTSYIGVMQFGGADRKPFYVGIGPYPGQKSAEKALLSHPAVFEATARAVVPVIGPEGFEELLRKVG